jgi:hypothetical protein
MRHTITAIWIVGILALVSQAATAKAFPTPGDAPGIDSDCL